MSKRPEVRKAIFESSERACKDWEFRLPPALRACIISSKMSFASLMTRRRWYLVDFTAASQRLPKCADGRLKCHWIPSVKMAWVMLRPLIDEAWSSSRAYKIRTVVWKDIRAKPWRDVKRRSAARNASDSRRLPRCKKSWNRDLRRWRWTLCARDILAPCS